jgi:hypothetical protein
MIIRLRNRKSRRAEKVELLHERGIAPRPAHVYQRQTDSEKEDISPRFRFLDVSTGFRFPLLVRKAIQPIAVNQTEQDREGEMGGGEQVAYRRQSHTWHGNQFSC